MSKNVSYKCQNFYFILITLVVFVNFSEIMRGGVSENFIYKTICMFHMPALLFLTGYTAQYNRRHIFSQLLCPYIFFQMIYMVLDICWINVRSDNPFALQFTRPKGILWYLLVVIFCHLLIPLINTKKTERRVLLLLSSVLLSLVIGYDTQPGVEPSVTRLISLFPFFVMGYYLGQECKWKNVFEKLVNKKSVKLMLGVGILLSFFYIWASPDLLSQALYWNSSYATLGYSVFTKLTFMIFAIMWIAFFSVGLSCLDKRIPLVSTIGKNIWGVYLLHGIVVQVLAKYGVLSGSTPKSCLLVFLFTILCLVLFGNCAAGKIYECLFTGKSLLLLLDRIIIIPWKSKINIILEKITSNSEEYLSRRQRIFYGISTVLFVISFFIFSITSYVIESFDNLTVEELIFHLKVPMRGTGNSMIIEYFVHEKNLIILLSFFYMIMLLIFLQYRKLRNSIGINKMVLGLSVVCLVVSFGRIVISLNVVQYIKNQINSSKFIEENYVDPNKITLVFPEKKRNLIYIYLESMESTFASKEEGGSMDIDLIPELTQLAKENINFSETDLVGGATVTRGGTWTIGAMVSQSAGLPLLLPIDGNSYGEYSSFLPGAVSIGEILEKNGYNQEIMVGSDMSFAGRDLFYQQHGNFEIWDYNTAIQKGKIDSSYYVWWGYEDKKLYEYAKEEIMNLSQQGEPFNFCMLTVDTHHVSGYVCDLCQNKSRVQYENVLGCASRQLYDFVQWIQQQDFYADTTIVISGDHPTMDEAYMKEHYDNTTPRKVYNCFINAIGDSVNAKKREFTTLDMFPTTLSAMGVQMDGEHLGLGTNLFSGEKTLVEQYGYEKVATELGYTSKFYNETILGE